MFQHITPYAGDPILSLVETFQQDPRSHKVNLSIGIYFDENGQLTLPESVRAAEQHLMVQARAYLPMEGHTGFRGVVQQILFGEQKPNIATVQTLGGSGALKLSADFFKQWFPQSHVYVSNPTWDNHRSIFEGAGLPVSDYPYYDPQTHSVAFDALCDFFQQLKPLDIVLLHPCCHNPTGIDLSPNQWDILLKMIQEKQLIPLMDMAYQGFGDGFEPDTYALHQAIKMGLPVWISYSFSKNMSLYGERVGALSVVCPDVAQAEAVLGQLKYAVRRIYSSPPTRGALIVHEVLNNPSLTQQWQHDVGIMRQRIQSMRQQLVQRLSTHLPEHDFGYLAQQKGMFSYTGLSPKQVARLQNDYAVYLVSSGRMCVAGLNEHNLDYVADCLAQVFA